MKIFGDPNGQIKLHAKQKIQVSFCYMFHSFFLQFSSKFHVFIFLFPILWSAGTAKSTIRQILFFFVDYDFSLAVWPRLDDPFVSRNPRELCVSHFPERILGCAYTIFRMVKFKLLAQLTVDHTVHLVVSSLILCANLLHFLSFDW